MRTKALLVTAASALVGASAMAQVVSVNVVGFINLTVPANGYALVANQLNTTDNKLATVIPTYVDNGQFILWDTANVTYKFYSYFAGAGGGWVDDQFNPANPTWAPGEAAFLFNPDTANPTTVTLVGEVPQGTALTVNLPPGYAMVSSIPPLAQDAVAAGIPTAEGEQLIKWLPATQSYSFFSFLGGSWLDDQFNPVTPALAVGEGFFIFNPGTALTWTRSFQVAP